MTDIASSLALIAAGTAAANPDPPVQIPGTVIGFDAVSYVATVDLDDGATVTAASLAGVLTVGFRVMVEFTPPQGVFVRSVLMEECCDGGADVEPGPGGSSLYVQETDPGLTVPGLWIQTGLDPDGDGMTFWVAVEV